MDYCHINPFIRFADHIRYKSPKNWVQVTDCRIFYILFGKVDIFIEKKHYELTPGSLFYCCSQSRYSFESEGVTCISLNFDLTQQDNERTTIYPRISVDDIDFLSTEDLSDTNEREYIDSHLFVPEAAEYLPYLEEILTEYANRRILYQEVSSSLLKKLLIQLQRQRLGASLDSASAVSEVIAFVRSNYAQPLNNKTLSAMTGYHEYHLNRLFLEHTGTSIHQYILNLRISEAQKMLRNTDLPLTLIAEKVGFHSNTHFSNYFKKTVGISPSEFRRRFKNTI